MAHGAAIWLPFVQPFATVFLGVGAFVVAHRQWRTANDKLRVDILDKRITALEVFQQGIQDLHEAGCSNADQYRDTEQRKKLLAEIVKLRKAMNRIEILFGSSFQDELRFIYEDLDAYVLWIDMRSGHYKRIRLQTLRYKVESRLRFFEEDASTAVWKNACEVHDVVEKKAIAYMQINARDRNAKLEKLTQFLMLNVIMLPSIAVASLLLYVIMACGSLVYRIIDRFCKRVAR